MSRLFGCSCSMSRHLRSTSGQKLVSTYAMSSGQGAPGVALGDELEEVLEEGLGEGGGDRGGFCSPVGGGGGGVNPPFDDGLDDLPHATSARKTTARLTARRRAPLRGEVRPPRPTRHRPARSQVRPRCDPSP